MIKPKSVMHTLICAAVLTLAGAAHADWTRSSWVADTVVDNGNGTWTYAYTLQNTSTGAIENDVDDTPWIVDWELPWFGDMGITDITSPWGWSYAIETIGTPNAFTGWAGVAAWQDPADPWYAGPTSPYTTGTQVLHWYSQCFTGFIDGGDGGIGCEWNLQNGIAPEQELNGFGFTANYAPTAAPYQASWATTPVMTGDPAFPAAGVPASPSVTGQSTGQVPEPGMLALLGLAGLAGILTRKRC